MSKPKAWCRTCAFLVKKEKNHIVCGHRIMLTLMGTYPFYERTNCLLWEKKKRKGKIMTVQKLIDRLAHVAHKSTV